MSMAEDHMDRDFDMSYSKLLHPDFSDYIRDGEFDATMALQLHLFTADFLIKTAIAMTTMEPVQCLASPEDRLLVIEMNLKTYREAVEAAVCEVNRLANEFPLRNRRREEAPRLEN
jgi:hypothetical protein